MANGVTSRDLSPHQKHGAAANNADLSVVIMGVGFYPRASIQTLSCAVNDAETAYAHFLSMRPETDVKLLVNEQVTVQRIRSAIAEAAMIVHGKGTLLVMYSGHGAPVKRLDTWEAAFLTSDFRSLKDLQFDVNDPGAFTLQDVKRWLKETGHAPRNIVFLLDSCGSGISILHDPADDKLLTIDGQSIIGRTIHEREVTLSDIGLQTSDTIRLSIDTNNLTWPGGSTFAAISAASHTGMAHEFPELGHGLFSLCVLDWLKTRFLRSNGTSDLSSELVAYVQCRLAKMRLDNGQTGIDLQKPDEAKSSAVEISNPGNLLTRRATHNLVSICRTMPVPRRMENVEFFDANVDAVLAAANRPMRYTGDSNLVLELPRFHGSRVLLKTVTNKLANTDAFTQPVIYLGTGRIRHVMPLIASLEDALETSASRQAEPVGPPLIADSAFVRLDTLVERLKQNRAIVVAPYNHSSTDDLIEYFLRRCVCEKEIRLLLALYADEPIPEWAKIVHYHRVKLTFPDRSVYHGRLEELGISVTAEDVPGTFLNDTVIGWIDTLKRLGGYDSDHWRKTTDVHLHPFREIIDGMRSENGIRAVLNVLQDLLPALVDNSEEGADGICLLQVMSVIALPRSRRLVEFLWQQLRQEGCLRGKKQNLDEALSVLTDCGLIRDSDDEDDTTERHYFVHSLVRLAAAEFDEEQRRDKKLWHRLAAVAFRSLLDDGESTWWPRAVIAHEAVHHFMEAEQPFDACRVLVQSWRDLTDSGYHENLLKWAQRLRIQITSSSLSLGRIRKSLEDLCPLLVHLEDLYKHRQEWGRIAELHRDLVKRTGGFRPEFESGDPKPHQDHESEIVTQWYWRSRHNLANYYFIYKNFEMARKEYQACYDWASNSGQTPDIEGSSNIRLAHCDILECDFEEARHRIAYIDSWLAELEASDPTETRKHRRHLRSIRIEEARLHEDADTMYELALDAWSECLLTVGKTGVQQRFDLAISCVHMGWASMLRGEFLRAWRFSRRARKMLNDRGIPEYWWYGETERIAALAIAQLFRDERPGYTPWYRKQRTYPDAAVQLLRSDVDVQQHNLEGLIKVCQCQNPWRAAELISALGQLIAHGHNQKELGIQRLKQAQVLAEAEGHRVLETYVLESLGVLHQGKESSDYFHRCWEVAKEAGLGSFSERRKKNWEESSEFVAKTVRVK